MHNVNYDCLEEAALSGKPRKDGGAGWLPWVALLPSWAATAWLTVKAQWFWTHQPDLQFGWIVLVLCGFLFWERWQTRPALRLRWTGAAFCCTLLGLGLLFLVQIYQAAFGTQPASIAGLALGVVCVISGNLSYVFGTAGLRHFGFAFGFLLIAMPMPTLVHNWVVGGLQSKVTWMTVEILKAFGVPAQRVGSLIRLPNCTVGVDEACSGIRSLQSTLMATLFIGQIALRHLSFKVVLVGAGVGLAIVGNLGRSLFLSYTASARGISALESMHDTAGWGILLFTAAGVVGLAVALSRLEKPAPALENRATLNGGSQTQSPQR